MREQLPLSMFFSMTAIQCHTDYLALLLDLVLILNIHPCVLQAAQWCACAVGDYDMVLASDQNAIIVVDKRLCSKARLVASVESAPWTGRKLSQYFNISSQSGMISISG